MLNDSEIILGNKVASSNSFEKLYQILEKYEREYGTFKINLKNVSAIQIIVSINQVRKNPKNINLIPIQHGIQAKVKILLQSQKV